MAVKLGSLRRDIKKQNDGDWVQLTELMDPRTQEIPEFRVRGINYGPFQIARSNLVTKMIRRYGTRPVPPEESHRDEGRLIAQHILLDWRHADPPYDSALAEEMLTDPAHPLQDYIRRCAAEVAEVEAEFTVGAMGNSVRSSDGNSKAVAAATLE